MEVNPRFQATIEAFEFTTMTNLVQMHLAACNGCLPVTSPRHVSTCARVIVYARQQCAIPDLRTLPDVVDISLPGSLADRGDPVCTVNHVATRRADALQGAWKKVDAVYRLLQPLNPAPKSDRK
jgi:predicted ATP-grasp superfamily ATP-dependent carboligase